MDCPACTQVMTEAALPVSQFYAGDIRRERYRCEPCGVTATVEIIFTVDERHAPSI